MRWMASLAIALSLMAASGSYAADAKPVPRPVRALWVWKPESFASSGELESLLAFAGKKRIGTLFLSAGTNLLQREPQLYRHLLSRAHAQGITVHALHGEPEWLSPDRRSGAVAFLEALRQYDRGSRPEERFDAIHLDVEPQSLPEWKAGKHGALAAQYLEFLDWIRHQAQPLALPLAVDVPVSFNRIAVGGRPLIAAILDRTDQMAVMAYKDSAGKVMEASREGMGWADAAGKKVWVGVSADPAHLPANSPGGPAESDLEAIAASVEAAFQGHSCFLGVAVHDYARYRRLVP